MFFRVVITGCFAILVTLADVVVAATPAHDLYEGSWESVSSPLTPEYVINPDESVTLRICFNWSCAQRQTVTFTANDMALVKGSMATCSDATLHDRLQQVRIGIWQMELLAQKYQPSLANDQAVNDSEAGVEGRTDCVDNASNTSTYLHILKDIGQLPGWTVSSPIVRNRFDVRTVHWTAVIIDAESKEDWSIDSWFRPNGHLPMIMPLQSWSKEKKGWESPFDRLNPTPYSVYELCSPAGSEMVNFKKTEESISDSIY